MATAKERQEFIDLFRTETVDSGKDWSTRIHDAKLLLRHVRTHGNIAVAQCNGPGDYVNQIPYPRAGEIYTRHEAWCEKREGQIEKHMKQIADGYGLTINFGGDPRGSTVKIHFPSGRYNTWGGRETGWGIPQ